MMLAITMVQSNKSANLRAIVRLDNGSYVAPSGIVIGTFRVVYPALTRDAALKMLASSFQAGINVSLWWAGAAEDIAAHVQVAK